MKKEKPMNLKPLMLVLIVMFVSNVIIAQTDSTQVTQQNNKPTKETKEKKDKKRRDEFKVFAGLNLNNISFDAENYEPTISPGFILGGSYKRGRFFYWEIGARYNNATYNLKDYNNSADTSGTFDRIFSSRNVDVPITVGINFLSITSRIVGLRLFVSAVPTFAIGVGSNDLGITKDNLNTFVMYGQGGVGLDVAFFFLETGFNYGFTDMFKDLQKVDKSNPYQIFINLGFRF